MNTEEHKQRHIELHKSLDELMGDFVADTGRMLSQTNMLDFLNWSYQQTVFPSELTFKLNKDFHYRKEEEKNNGI